MERDDLPVRLGDRAELGRARTSSSVGEPRLVGGEARRGTPAAPSGSTVVSSSAIRAAYGERVGDVHPQVRVAASPGLLAGDQRHAREVVPERDERRLRARVPDEVAEPVVEPEAVAERRARASVTRRMSTGVGSNVWTSPPLGTRLSTLTRSPPTSADQVREDRRRRDDRHRPSSPPPVEPQAATHATTTRAARRGRAAAADRARHEAASRPSPRRPPPGTPRTARTAPAGAP